MPPVIEVAVETDEAASKGPVAAEAALRCTALDKGKLADPGELYSSTSIESGRPRQRSCSPGNAARLELGQALNCLQAMRY